MASSEVQSKHRTVAIIQARLGSKRLPNKVLAEIAGVSVIEHVHDRVRKSQYLDDVVVAIPVGRAEDSLRALLSADRKSVV